ncbi:molybdopterin-binding protein [uncultured Chryseobacterium sp.]|uniref:molybdopterin-binding protein n=1 Tax=uncultured Chryseobacterium sp. TaxID=259322 RepID=UPI0037491BC2
MKIFTVIMLLFASLANAQHTETIQVTGAIKEPLTITEKSFSGLPVHSMDSLVILNHAMEYKSTLRKLKGVLLKDILAKAQFKTASPKELSTFYLICKAKDGYQVVYSWNELFNGETGDKAMIITQSEGSPKEGFALVTPTDRATGRRYVKNLSEIIIQQIH